MSEVYDLGAYRAIVKGVQEFFMQTQIGEYPYICCKHDDNNDIDVSYKQYHTDNAVYVRVPIREGMAMPPKGWTAGREETEVKAVRLPKSLIERIARHVERLQVQFRFGRINEGMAIRDLIELGLDTVEASEHQRIPQQLTVTQTQPAIPLALEPAPKAAVAPMDLQDDAPQEIQPSQLLRTDTPQPQPPLVPHATLTPESEAEQKSQPVLLRTQESIAEPTPKTAKVQYEPPGTLNCDAGLGHPPYPASSKECPKCGNNRRARESKGRRKEKQVS